MPWVRVRLITIVLCEVLDLTMSPDPTRTIPRLSFFTFFVASLPAICMHYVVAGIIYLSYSPGLHFCTFFSHAHCLGEVHCYVLCSLIKCFNLFPTPYCATRCNVPKVLLVMFAKDLITIMACTLGPQTPCADSSPPLLHTLPPCLLESPPAFRTPTSASPHPSYQ
jgi:hypothetical protein